MCAYASTFLSGFDNGAMSNAPTYSMWFCTLYYISKVRTYVCSVHTVVFFLLICMYGSNTCDSHVTPLSCVQYGRAALEVVLQSIRGVQRPLVTGPEYNMDFFDSECG